MRAAPLLIVIVAGCGLNVAGRIEGDASTPANDDASTIDGGIAGDDATTGADGATDAGANDVLLPPIPAGRALSFKKSGNQYVDFPHIPLPNDFTVEAWVKPATFGSEMVVASEDRTLNTEDQFRLSVGITGNVYFVMTDQNSNYYGLFNLAVFTLQSATPLVLGKWSHLAVTKSGAAFTLYVDGAVVATVNASSATFTHTQNFNFRIAARMGNGGPSDYFDGIIDDVRFYKRARSAAELAGDRSTALSEASPGFSDLVTYWRLDETTGTVVVDDKKAFDGTLKNEPTRVMSDAF